MSKTPHILIIYTGGTIGMMKDYKTNVLKSFDFKHIYNSIPELNLLNCSIETISFEKPIDSSNVNPSHWAKIASIIQLNYQKADGFVVLHGSDTMSYTASAISFMIENLDKPIIFTGSQLPIGHLRTDAKENMITAIEIAASHLNGKPQISEVCIYFEYKLYRANRTTKISAAQFKAFDSPNYPILAESGVELKFYEHSLLPKNKSKKLIFRKMDDYNILLIKLFPGLTETVFNHLLNTPVVHGIILETFGSGNAPTEKWFLEALKDTLKKEIPIVIITQCVAGSVILGKYETSVALLEMGLIDGKDITTEAAVTKLMYLLNIPTVKTKLKELFETSLRGEISNI